MPYDIMATAKNPALIIYLLDLSASMSLPLGNKTRLEGVLQAWAAARKSMIFRSTKGGRVSPRYRMAIYGYSNRVYDLLDGPRTITEVATLGIPDLSPMRTTETALAFLEAEKLLQQELPRMQDCPAPLVCHMTDGQFTGDDPEPIVKRIMSMGTPDGNVLVENIFISDEVLAEPVVDPARWDGVLADTPLVQEYAQKLRAISSPLPESYREMMLEFGYRLSPGAVMLLPGMSPELVAMGFQMSAATR